jgi:hypothetical protein
MTIAANFQSFATSLSSSSLRICGGGERRKNKTNYESRFFQMLGNF